MATQERLRDATLTATSFDPRAAGEPPARARAVVSAAASSAPPSPSTWPAWAGPTRSSSSAAGWRAAPVGTPRGS